MRVETILLVLIGVILLVLASRIRRRSVRRAAREAVRDGMAHGPSTIQETPVVPSEHDDRPADATDDRRDVDGS